MKSIDIKGTARVAGGKKAAKELRKQNMVPCNIYGEKRGENNLPVAECIAISNDELRNLIYTPHIYSVNLNIDGQVRKAVMREIQFHPVKDNVLHVDFYEINETKPIVMEVPIKLNGLAEGVKAGGKLAAGVRKLKVRAPYTQIPEVLDIDVTNLGLGKVIKVAELNYEGLEMVTSPSVVVCQVNMTRAAASAAAAAKGK